MLTVFDALDAVHLDLKLSEGVDQPLKITGHLQ
jgi:hypothetical protein